MNEPTSQTLARRKSEGAASRFKPVRSARAFEEIAQQIRDELSAGSLTVGDRLPSERALSEQFGVSRNTLREALRSLEYAGLVRFQKGATGGAFIAERSDKAIATGLMDLYNIGAIRPAHLTEARIWLEAIVVREACQRITRAEIEALNRNIDEAEQADRQGDFRLSAAIHIEFHNILAKITDNPIIMIVMNSVLEVLAHYISKLGYYENKFVIRSRRRFMKFLVEGDANGAVAEMETSLKRLQRNYLSAADEPEPTAPPAPAKRPAKKKPATKRK